MPFTHLSTSAFSTTWSLIGGGSTGEARMPPHSMAVASVQFSGSFGGGEVALEISNDGETWFPLTSAEGTAISAESDAIFDISTAARFVRPAVTGGDGGTDIEAILMVWRA